MRKFKVGDYIIGNKFASGLYGITGTGTKWYVKEPLCGDNIKVEKRLNPNSIYYKDCFFV